MQYRCHIPASIAIVGRTPDCDKHAVMHNLVAFHDQLMCSRDKLQVVRINEFLRNVTAKEIACASRRYSPARYIIGIRPQKIAHGTFVRHFLLAVKIPYLEESLVGAALYTTMSANLVYRVDVWTTVSIC